MGNVNDLNLIEQTIICLIDAEIESMKTKTPNIEQSSGWKPLCHGDTTDTYSGVEVGIGNYSKKRAIANNEFHIEISNERTLIVYDKKNRYQVINDADKRAAAIQAIFNAVPQKYWGKSTNQVIPHVSQPTPVIPATDPVPSINTQAPVTSQASGVNRAFENHISASSATLRMSQAPAVAGPSSQAIASPANKDLRYYLGELLQYARGSDANNYEKTISDLFESTTVSVPETVMASILTVTVQDGVSTAADAIKCLERLCAAEASKMRLQ